MIFHFTRTENTDPLWIITVHLLSLRPTVHLYRFQYVRRVCPHSYGLLYHLRGPCFRDLTRVQNLSNTYFVSESYLLDYVQMFFGMLLVDFIVQVGRSTTLCQVKFLAWFVDYNERFVLYRPSVNIYTTKDEEIFKSVVHSSTRRSQQKEKPWPYYRTDYLQGEVRVVGI